MTMKIDTYFLARYLDSVTEWNTLSWGPWSDFPERQHYKVAYECALSQVVNVLNP